MFQRKYRFAKNRGLFPLLPQPSLKRTLPYCALLSSQHHQDYTVEVKDDQVKMFNCRQYLHRQFQKVVAGNSLSTTLDCIKGALPLGKHSLVMLIANQNHQSPSLVLGQQDLNGIIQMTYQRMTKARQSSHSEMALWVVGLESENALTDQLGVEWSDRLQQGHSTSDILNSKQRVRVVRQGQRFTPQAVTTFTIRGQNQLKELLEHYKWAKAELQEQVAVQKHCCYLLGQIYCLEQIQKQPSNIEIDDQFGISSPRQGKVLSSMTLVRLNQYARANSPLLLSLGMLLRKLSSHSLSLTDCLDSKLFKILSSSLTDPGCSKILLQQIGHSMTLKQEHLKMAPLAPDPSKQLPPNLNQYFYTQHPHQFPQCKDIIPCKEKPKDYPRVERVQTQPSNTPDPVSLLEASASPKAYKLPKLIRAPCQITKGLRSIKKNRATSLPQKREENESKVGKEHITQAIKGREQIGLKRTNTRLNESFYEETKAWLSHAYGHKSMASSSKALKKQRRSQKRCGESVQVSRERLQGKRKRIQGKAEKQR